MLNEIPEGYFLQTFDDCGFSGRMPHVPADTLRYTFPEGSVDASLRDRTISNGMPNFKMHFQDMKQDIPYILAITYASEKEQPTPRVQSLYAGNALIHGPYKLPVGTSQRILFSLPKESIQNGKLELSFVLNEGPNAVVSVVELWAPIPSPKVLILEAIPSITGKIHISVLNLACDGISGVNVSVQKEGIGEFLEVFQTQADGRLELDASKWVSLGEKGALEISAIYDGLERKAKIDFSELYFIPPCFRPIPAQNENKPTELSLNGTWRICITDVTDIIPNRFDGSEWSDFQVPGQWLQQGFQVSGEQIVCMAKEFIIPQNWSGSRQFIRFDAIHGGATYWLNGHILGTSENLFTPIEFDITQFANIGDINQLVIKLKHDTPSEIASYSSGYAFHCLGGIDRSVRLFSLPETHISRFHIETSLDSNYEDGQLALTFEIDNLIASKTAEVAIDFELQDPEGNRIAFTDPKTELSIPAGELKGFTKSFQVEKPLKWSAEKPFLYNLVVRLYQCDELIEQIVCRIGFRSIQVHGNNLILNGKTITLFGVNRHEINPLSGRADTAKHAYQDAQLFKDANFNYIRTSHYPPTQEFIDACDQIGVYVECEAPFCWTRGRGEDDPGKTKIFLTPTSAMVEAYRDHPSVIMWSLANESGNIFNGKDCLNLNFQATLDYCHNQDPTRPVVFSNEWNRDGKACDVAVLHYPPLDLDSCSFIEGDPRPVLMDEYFPPQTFTFEKELYLNPGLDIVNWSTGQNAQESIWNRMYRDPRVLGGAIWAGVDEEFIFNDGSVKGYGAWGFIDVWRRPKSLWWDAKRIFSPIWIPIRQVTLSEQEVIKIPVENRYSFNDLSELTIQWQIASEIGNICSSLPPGTIGELKIPIHDHIDGSLLILRFFDNHYNLITAHGIRLGERQPEIIPKANAGCPIIEENGEKRLIKGENFAFTIHLDTGETLPDFGFPGLLRLPLLFVARQESKNAFNPNGLEYMQFPIDGVRTIDDIKFSRHDNALEIIITEHFKDFVGTVNIMLDKSGYAELSFDYVYTGEAFTMSEFGLQIPLDNRYQKIWWRRQTEWDIYPDDHIGRSEGEAYAHQGFESGNTSIISRTKKPDCSWHLDENEYGTRDFRATKYNIYEAEVTGEDGSGIQILSNGTTDIRVNLADKGVMINLLVSPIQSGRDNQMGCPVRMIQSGDHLIGSFSIKFLGMS
jgi:beta-galactosidase